MLLSKDVPVTCEQKRGVPTQRAQPGEATEVAEQVTAVPALSREHTKITTKLQNHRPGDHLKSSWTITKDIKRGPR